MENNSNAIGTTPAVGAAANSTTGSNTTGSSTKEATTLKIVSNKRYLGPKTEAQKAKVDLSTATGKVLFNNDMKFVTSGKEERASSQKPKSSTSQAIGMPVNGEAEYAAYYMYAWDKLYSFGTEAYKQKYLALQTARQEAYAKLGIQVSDGNRPELQAQQRELYNEMVSPYSFSFF